MRHEMRVYHFAKIENGVPVMRDGTPIEIGKKYTVDNIKMCERGFHGSVDPLDALMYAPGSYISIRELSGKIIKGDDKVVASECVHVVGFDGEEMLRKFARLCALDVIHLWDAPDVAVRYLKTGDESIRRAALDAARRAALDAARRAAWAAALDAASAARRAALAAARRAAWAAARNAARYAAWDAASAARRAALAAARDAAWAKLIKIQSRRLKRMVDYRIKKGM
jgi:hypothetical protein